MSDRPAGLRRDATILLRYRWFILIVLTVALAGALAVGITRTPDHAASAVVEARPTQQRPVLGSSPAFVFADYQALDEDESDRVARGAADLLVEQGLQMNSGALAGKISQSEVTPPELKAFGVRQLQFTASDSDESKAIAYAEAWAKAWVEQAETLRDGHLNDYVTGVEAQSAAAAANLDERQRAVDDFLRQHPGVATASLSALVTERGRVTRALARLKAIDARGRVGPDELRIALADLFPEERASDKVDLPTLIGGLGLRLDALNDEIAAYQGRDTVADQAQRLVAAANAAERAYDSALAEASAARAAQTVVAVEFSVVKTATSSDSRRAGFVGLLAAAAAFGLAVGVVGAFAIEFVARTRPLPWQDDRGPASDQP